MPAGHGVESIDSPRLRSGGEWVPRGSALRPDGAKPAVPGTWLGVVVVVHVG
jgi:hypothetical protein